VEATGAPRTRSATQTTPSAAAAGSAQLRWPAASAHAQQRRNRKGEERDAEHARDGDGEVRVRPVDRAAQRSDRQALPAPGRRWGERLVEGREEPDVEIFGDHENAQYRPPRLASTPARTGAE
jgi:hypothetical protein